MAPPASALRVAWIDARRSNGFQLRRGAWSPDRHGARPLHSGGSEARHGVIHVLSSGDDATAQPLNGLKKLEKLNMRYCNCITDSDMEYLSDLTNLRELQLSSCKISDYGVSYLRGLHKLGHLNLEGCAVTAACLEVISGLGSLVLLNLSRCGICDEGCENLEVFKNLQSLEVCGGLITDAGVKNIKDLKALTLLNLSQNGNLTDKTLELISGLTVLVSLNVSNSQLSNSGLHHLKPLQNLRSLSLDSCRVTASEIDKLRLVALPNLISVRPE